MLILTRRKRALGTFLLALCAIWGASIPAAHGLSLQQRLAMFPATDLPLHAPAELRWNDYQVPFISVSDERDLPLLIGLVHGHLRRAQMEMLRRIAQGRTAEMAGPLAVDLDELLHSLDLTRAVAQIEAGLPEATRAWLARYVQGLNLQGARLQERPADAQLLGLPVDEPWTLQDVLSIVRLGAVDISLARKLGLLKIRDEPGFAAYSQRLRAYDAAGEPSFGPGEPTPLGALGALGKAGSNSIVIAGHRSRSGAPLIANDPHLGYLLPNLWVLLAYRTPTQAVVGFSLPGAPAVVVGRNTQLGFGGTNMAAYSHGLYALDAEAEIRTRQVELRVRGWRDRTLTLRDSALGPLLPSAGRLKDLNLPPRLALLWRGHQPSDEFSSFLAASHARDGDSYRAAFADYAVAGQNLLYATAQGEIGQLLAVEQIPAAARNGEALIEPAQAAQQWSEGILPSSVLPQAKNPAAGYLLSANNTPLRTDPPLSLGGNQNDRILRMQALIEAQERLGVEDLARIQRDTLHLSALAAAQAAVAVLEDVSLPASAAALRTQLANWDGRFEIDSEGAAAWFHVASRIVDQHYRTALGEPLAEHLRNSLALQSFIRDDLRSGTLSVPTLVEVFTAAARASRGQRWGDLHRLRVQHPLGRIPLLGRGWRYADIPLPGNGSTVAKSSGPWNGEAHNAYFGQQSRHISDLADIDSNWFVLLGGNDGWIGSANFLDQLPLFQAGDMLQLPLSPEAVPTAYPHRLPLTAAQPE